MSEEVKAKAADEIFCASCGNIIKREAEICPKCGVRVQRKKQQREKKHLGVLLAPAGFILSLPFILVTGVLMDDGGPKLIHLILCQIASLFAGLVISLCLLGKLFRPPAGSLLIFIACLQVLFAVLYLHFVFTATCDGAFIQVWGLLVVSAITFTCYRLAGAAACAQARTSTPSNT